jgi:hypothetical protein
MQVFMDACLGRGRIAGPKLKKTEVFWHIRVSGVALLVESANLTPEFPPSP